VTMGEPFIKKYSVSFYFLLTIAISWGGIFLVMGSGGIQGTMEVSENMMPFVYLATLLGPAVAGILMTGLVDGKIGFRELWFRLSRGRVNIRWYAVALLTAPFIIAMILLILAKTSPTYLPVIVTTNDKVNLLFTGIAMGLAVGFFEELGWTGFALPKLRMHYGVLTTGIILGLFWGLWHLPLFMGNAITSGTIPPTLYLIVLLFSFLPAYRVLMVWLYERTGSLLLVILMHAPLAGSQLVLIPPEMSGEQIAIYDLIFAALLWCIIIGVTIFNRGQWASQEAKPI
jgi:uncharacterized protein